MSADGTPTGPEAGTRAVLGGASWRITRGDPTPEELAALAVVLTARLRAAQGGEGAAAPRRGASWDGCPGRRPAPAWTARSLPGWRPAA
ncbi:acyl-CoA carboxylase epsilon subunit [Streptomyces sp. HM190]|uniref:acyl-CoA carboxylase epsilon subunit n=1 Tax=Streptomyces sp. HM190 TaxID=2695266 RepID=UPI00135A4ADC|nr:acyl-CoA carboxylase epsilon subunit [Streptomyces sp. HM190]